MKKIIAIVFVLCFSYSAIAGLPVSDSKESVIGVLDAYDSIGLPLTIPSNISPVLGFNNGNGILSPGEIAILNVNHSSSSPFTCLVKLEEKNRSKWVTQEKFAEHSNSLTYECLNNNHEDCFISFTEFQLKKEKDQIFVSASTNIPPGTRFKCISTDNIDLEFDITD